MPVFTLDDLYLEFPEIENGLIFANLDRAKQEALFKRKYEEIYYYQGIRQAFKDTAKCYASESGITTDYERHLERLEMYMTAHLLVLWLINKNTNLAELPNVNGFGRANVDKVDTFSLAKGNVFSILSATNIGQRLLAMLRINSNNMGGLL